MAKDYEKDLIELEVRREANNNSIRADGVAERKPYEQAINELPENDPRADQYRNLIGESKGREEAFVDSNNRTMDAKREEIKAEQFQATKEAALDTKLVDPPPGGSQNTSQTYQVGANLGDPSIAYTQNLPGPGLNTEKETPNLPPEGGGTPLRATVLQGVQKGMDGIEKAEAPSDLVTPMVILGVAGAAIAKDAYQSHMRGVDKLADAHASPGTTEIQNQMLANINSPPSPEAPKVASVQMEGGPPATASNVEFREPPPPPPPPPANDNTLQK